MSNGPAAADWAVYQPAHVDGVSLLRAHFVEHQFERHSHEGWSIGVTFAGMQTFRCRGTTSTSTQGNVIVFRPDEAHDGHAGDAQGFRYAMLYLDDAVVQGWLAESAARGARSFDGALLHDPYCAAALARAAAAAVQPAESLRAETLLREAVLDLFERHAQRPRAAWKERSAPGWLQSVRDYLRAHYAEDVRVYDLARIARVSRVHVTRAYTQAYGVPPHVHLNTLRLRAALRLLAEGRPIAEVALEAGFSDQSHFTRRFKGSFGMAPARWLRQAGLAAGTFKPNRR